MTPTQLTDEQLKQFHEDGYLFLRDRYSAEEVDLLKRVALADRAIASAGSMADGTGGKSKIWITQDVQEDIYSAVARGDRMVAPLRQIFADEPMHFHHKMMLKEPRVGGAWEWHQDYGYWYNDGFLWPDMVSVMIAVDEAKQENGCLQVIRGSHKLGRIEHGVVGGQTGADATRVDGVLKKLERVYCEMKPGTAVIFHSNTLHRSDQNTSELSRWSLICCYSARYNTPVPEATNRKNLPQVVPIEVLDDDAVLSIGQEQLERLNAAAEA